MRVLVVDDSDMQRVGIAEAVERLGHEVRQSCDGSEAVEFFRTALASGKPFDLVLSDVQMSRMDGTDLHAKIKSELGTCRFILMSGFLLEKARSYAQREGIPTLSKPVGRDDLLAALTA